MPKVSPAVLSPKRVPEGKAASETRKPILRAACRCLGFLPQQAGPISRIAVAATALGWLTLALPASAGDLVIGLGIDNLDDNDSSEAASLQLEYHFDPIRQYEWGSVAAIGVAETDEDEDLYLGAGLSLTWNVSPSWFVESSLTAGYYDAGTDSVDLGGDVQFRTLFGVGYRLTETSRISIAFDHLSNAGLEDENPGRNAVSLRYARSF